jgi:hypothetical protein
VDLHQVNLPKANHERCIIASPASLPFVQTLVAIKSESSKCNWAASSPYHPRRGRMGEE